MPPQRILSGGKNDHIRYKATVVNNTDNPVACTASQSVSRAAALCKNDWTHRAPVLVADFCSAWCNIVLDGISDSRSVRGEGRDWEKFFRSEVYERCQHSMRPSSNDFGLLLLLLFRLLVFAEDETKIQSQDFFITLKYLSLNPVARPHVWTWTRVNWSRLTNRYSTLGLR